MTYQGIGSQTTNQEFTRVMEPEQFNQVIEAILAGKYSLACVLILQFGGYNPLHYIPYRTYNRIIKDQYQTGDRKKLSIKPIDSPRDRTEPIENRQKEQKGTHKITDLHYLEPVNSCSNVIQGGTLRKFIVWTEELQLEQRYKNCQNGSFYIT
ncbi:MAG: HetP family heterocyst commitment protein [Leptolyngbyaceae cyanobacterium RU_5_1]|nr:HetP family heterocyst commitment protein [Leptolyngbyaceae cyanobacterium RU_5_1]